MDRVGTGDGLGEALSISVLCTLHFGACRTQICHCSSCGFCRQTATAGSSVPYAQSTRRTVKGLKNERIVFTNGWSIGIEL